MFRTNSKSDSEKNKPINSKVMNMDKTKLSKIMDDLGNYSFILCNENINATDLLIENSIIHMAINYTDKHVYDNMLLLTTNVIRFFDILANLIDLKYNDFVQKETYAKMLMRLEEKKLSFISFQRNIESIMKMAYPIYLKIYLDENCIEYGKFIILAGTVMNSSSLELFKNKNNFGENAYIPPSSKVALIYLKTMCPIPKCFLTKYAILRLYNDYTVVFKLNHDLKYFIWDGYNLCWDNRGNILFNN